MPAMTVFVSPETFTAFRGAVRAKHGDKHGSLSAEANHALSVWADVLNKNIGGARRGGGPSAVDILLDGWSPCSDCFLRENVAEVVTAHHGAIGREWLTRKGLGPRGPVRGT